MQGVTFDTLEYSYRLQKIGISREHAEAMAEVNASALRSMIDARESATKNDLAVANKDLQVEIAQVKKDLQVEIAQMKAELEKSLGNVQHNILKWKTSVIIVQTILIISVLA